MVEIQQLEEGVVSVQGFRATGVSCGLKNGGSKDIALLLSETPCNTAMAFTKNRIQGAHIIVDKQHVNQQCQAIIINSGNANCLTGQEGLDNALMMLELLGQALDIDPMLCLVASTGIIGVPLSMTRVKYGIERLVNVIPNESNSRNFCSAIATSDTRHKNLAYRFRMGDDMVTIGVSAKGESMIKPWLETMHGTLLVVMTSDINISQQLLQKSLSKVLGSSFNRMSVDNDMSPNDSVFFLANGLAGNAILEYEDDPRYPIFLEVLQKITLDICKQLLKQGLGTTRLVHLQVLNANSQEEAENLIRAVASSYQVKSGLFGQKLPWQKIINVIANSTVDFDINNLILSVNGSILFQNGAPNNAQIAATLLELTSLELCITIDLQKGNLCEELWTCDLTHEYVKHNSVLLDHYS